MTRIHAVSLTWSLDMEHVKCEEIAAFLRGKSLESVAEIFTGKDLDFLTFQYQII